MNNRLQKIRSGLRKQNLDAVLISSPSTITYFTNYSGFSSQEREAFLFITKNKQYVITDGRYSEAVVEKIPHFTLIEISIKTPLKKIFQDLSKKLKIKRLGVEENNITIVEYKLFKRYFSQISPTNLMSLRIVKDKDELKNIEQACKLGDEAFDYILKRIKQGITEKELAFELELSIKKQEADISFKPIVAFGKNSSVPHHQTGNERLTTNSIVLLDFGVKLNNYCSDMTRTVFFGSANAKFKKMYQTVLNAQTKAIEFLRSNDSNHRSAKYVDALTRNHIIESGYPTIPHSLGHGIGLEVHEAPRLGPTSKDILKPGMVFSIEPGIYIKGVGGIRIEDLVVLENKGPRLITHSPRSLLTLSQ